MTETRQQIASHVETNPGVHFSAICRNLDIATGQGQYHLRRLVRNGTLIREDICGRTHYYPEAYPVIERRAMALLRRETTRELVLVLLEHGEMSPTDLVQQVGVARSTIEWHISNLLEYELVEKRIENRAVMVALTRPEMMRELLVEIEPSLSDRLVDRFTRLVDSVIEP